MKDASALTDRIAEVLLCHQYWRDPYYICMCQRDGPELTMGPSEHAAHVAEAVVAALDLREEAALSTVTDGNFPPVTTGLAAFKPVEKRWFRRFVTPWVGVLGEDQGQ